MEDNNVKNMVAREGYVGVAEKLHAIKEDERICSIFKLIIELNENKTDFDLNRLIDFAYIHVLEKQQIIR